MATVDLFNLIFVEILKISPNLLSQYYTIQDRIIHLLFLPHVILFLFLWGFGMMIVPPSTDNPNKGLRYLITLTAYIVIVYQGWYGTFLIPLLQTWFYIMLFFGLFLFFISKIFHPLTAKKFGNVGTAMGKSLGEKMARGKQVEALEDELKFIRKRMDKLKGKAEGGSDPAATYEYENYKRQEETLKREIKKLS